MMPSLLNPKRKRFATRLIIAIAALLAGVFAVVYFTDQSQPASGQSLADIETIDTLRTQFNRDAGKIRLIMIVSPT